MREPDPSDEAKDAQELEELRANDDGSDLPPLSDAEQARLDWLADVGTELDG